MSTRRDTSDAPVLDSGKADVITQRTKILEALSARGWRLVGTADGGWWADEVVVVESEWSPTGRRLFVTFLVDPIHREPRSKGEDVWAVAVTPGEPQDRVAAETGPRLSLGPGWEGRLVEFVRQVDSLRDLRSNSTR